MVIVVSRPRAVVALAAVVVAALVAASLMSSAVGAATKPATTYTRIASCAGLSFYPTDSQTTYANNGALRTRTDNGSGSGVFRCDPGLPNHAVVTKVEFTASLVQVTQTAIYGVGNCALRRSSLAVTNAGSNQTMATKSFRGSPPGGPQRVTATPISYATVNNANYGYWLECVITGWQESNAGIFGADVYYTISASNG